MNVYKARKELRKEGRKGKVFRGGRKMATMTIRRVRKKVGKKRRKGRRVGQRRKSKGKRKSLKLRRWCLRLLVSWHRGKKAIPGHQGSLLREGSTREG